jgi:cellulose synthase/poly-beta-1,6-N-acetylglucosamine synthase-like glycosyltransferase
MPKVSVVMSVYNGERYLAEAIESILAQTFPDFEFIIIDDGSTDSTPDILNRYDDARIVLVRNQENIGLTRSLNRGIRMAHGDYVARQDADDVALPERLAAQVSFLDEHPGIGVVGTWVAYIDENGRPIKIIRTPASPALIRWLLLFGTCLMHSSVLIRRSCLEGVAVYRSEILYAQDYDLWIRLSAKTRLANLPEILQQMRVHEQRISIQHYEQQEQIVRGIMQRTMTSFLGGIVPETMIVRLRRVSNGKPLETPQELLPLADLIMCLHQAYITQNVLDAVERRLVAEDAAYRLAQLGVLHARRWPLLAGRSFWQAIRLSPWLLTNPVRLKWLVYSFREAEFGGGK